MIGFFHAVVVVPDLEESLASYRESLNGRVTYAWEHDLVRLTSLIGYDAPSARAVIVTYPAGGKVELCELRRPRQRDAERVTREWCDAGVSVVAFPVSEIDGLVDQLGRAGVRLHGEVAAQVLNGGGMAKVVYMLCSRGNRRHVLPKAPRPGRELRPGADRRDTGQLRSDRASLAGANA